MNVGSAIDTDRGGKSPRVVILKVAVTLTALAVYTVWLMWWRSLSLGLAAPLVFGTLALSCFLATLVVGKFENNKLREQGRKVPDRFYWTVLGLFFICSQMAVMQPSQLNHELSYTALLIGFAIFAAVLVRSFQPRKMGYIIAITFLFGIALFLAGLVGVLSSGTLPS